MSIPNSEKTLFKSSSNPVIRNAGFFVYIDLSPYLPRDDYLTPRNREFSLAERLVDAGVFLHPGEEHSRDIGWFRLVFSQEEEILQEGFNR